MINVVNSYFKIFKFTRIINLNINNNIKILLIVIKMIILINNINKNCIF